MQPIWVPGRLSFLSENLTFKQYFQDPNMGGKYEGRRLHQIERHLPIYSEELGSHLGAVAVRSARATRYFLVYLGLNSETKRELGPL